MGVVYEAEQISLNRRVALKVLPFAATLDPRQLQRFRHEAQAVAMLHHSNIVPVYGVGCERGVHYYAMQLIEGQSLAAIIEAERGRRLQEATGATALPAPRAQPVPVALLALVAHTADRTRPGTTRTWPRPPPPPRSLL
jgi:hypothetical protein